MKTLRSIASLFGLVMAAAMSSPAKASAENTPLPVDPKQPLQIIIHDNVMLHKRDLWTHPKMETERFYVLRDALRRAADEIEYPGELKIDRFAAGTSDLPQRLVLHVYRWEKGLETFGRSLSVDFAMEATLQIGDEEWDMGPFIARSSHFALGGIDAEDFRPAAERAIEQLIELYRHAIPEESPTTP